MVRLTLEILQPRLSEVIAIDAAALEELGHAYSEQPWEPSHFGLDLPGKWTYSSLATQENRVRGFWISSLREPLIHTHRVAVDAGWRSRGVATAMLQFLAEGALRDGIDVLTLSVSPDNPTATAFYRGHGFVPAKDEELVRLLGPRRDEVLIGPDYYETREGVRRHLFALSLDRRRLTE